MTDTTLAPAFPERNVAAVLACDDNYAPLLAVAAASFLRHADPAWNYDIVVLEDGLSGDNRRRLLSLAGRNASIRFVGMRRWLRDSPSGRFHVSNHVSVATYYRIFLPEILAAYAKALYLDCDLVVLGDAARLFATDFGDTLLAAAPDLTMRHHLEHGGGNEPPGGWRGYLETTLGLTRAEDYFQAGVLVMNLEALRRADFTRRCLERLRDIGKPRYWDQCVLNSVCLGRVARLGLEWNQMWMLGARPDLNLEAVEAELPADCREEFARARARPEIIHYFTHIKAWMRVDAEYSDHFWRHARLTPFYEELLARFARSETARILRDAALSPASTLPARLAVGTTI